MFQQGGTHTLLNRYLLTLFILLVTSAEIALGHNFPRNVSIPGLGDLIGYYNNHSNVISFLGIPYAKPPTGKLRFQLPEAISWNGTRNATSEPPMCMQGISDTSDPLASEDCLYLSVYVPGNITNKNNNLSVMVWIHGGGFKFGYGNFMNVRPLASFGDVIVVTINYRLNIFGFFSSGDKTLPGNAGLHDQVMALKWVKTNIRSFGGDPDKVTIFGQSSGATSIYILLATNLTDGLFARAVMQSGLIWPVQDPKKSFKTITNLNSCPHIHVHGKDHDYATRKQIECMQSKTADELLASARNPQAPNLAPITDNVFLHSDILKQLTAKKKNVPCLIGLNNNELISTREDIPDIEALKKQFASFGDRSYSPVAVDLILSKFLTSDLEKTFIDAFLSMAHGQTQRIAAHVSEPKETYMYYFMHHPSFTKPNNYTGAKHNDELAFVFGKILKNSSATSDEKILSKNMIDIWSSFARGGVPQLPNGIKWPPYGDDRSYVELNVNITADNVKQRLREGDRIFWNQLIPKIEKMTSGPMNTSMKDTMGMMTTMSGMHHHHVTKSIAWGMSEQAVQDLLLSLLILLIFMTVITVTLILILCKIRTIKLAAAQHNGIPDRKISAVGTGNINNAFTNDTNKSKIESITAL